MIYEEEAVNKGQPKRAGLWLLVLGIFLVALNLRASLTAIGPVVKEIRVDTGLSNTLTGLLTTLPLITFGLVSPFAARFGRRFGLEQTLLAGLLILAVGIVVRPLPSEILLFGGTILIGTGISIINVLLPGFVKREFPLHVGIMTGMFIVCMGFGAALGAGLSNPLAQGAGLGWRGMLAGWSVITFVAIIFWLPRLRFHHRPEAGLTPDMPSGKLRHSKLAWQVTLYMGVQSLIFYIIVAWLPEMLYQWGLDITTAGWMLSLFQLVGLPASLIMPILAGRSANQRGLVAISAGSMLLFTTTLLPLWIFLTGFGSGASISLALSFFGLRSHNPQQTAELSGMAQSVGYLLAASGPTFIGFIHDVTHGWTVPLIILLFFTGIMLVLGLMAGKEGYVTPAADQS
jgi:CP family cyanate transporter-like MFS transporter